MKVKFIKKELKEWWLFDSKKTSDDSISKRLMFLKMIRSSFGLNIDLKTIREMITNYPYKEEIYGEVVDSICTNSCKDSVFYDIVMYNMLFFDKFKCFFTCKRAFDILKNGLLNKLDFGKQRLIEKYIKELYKKNKTIVYGTSAEYASTINYNIMSTKEETLKLLLALENIEQVTGKTFIWSECYCKKSNVPFIKVAFIPEKQYKYISSIVSEIREYLKSSNKRVYSIQPNGNLEMLIVDFGMRIK